MKAALVLEPGQLSVCDVSVDPPRAGEVLVRMAATGVCASDLSVLRGHVPMPLRMADGRTRLHLQGREVAALAMLGCMAEYAVVPAMSVLSIDPGIPLDRAAL